MGMNDTPSSERLHIGFFGRRNAEIKRCEVVPTTVYHSFPLRPPSQI